MKKCPNCKQSMKKDMKAGIKQRKVKKVMEEYKAGELHSGSKKGPRVKNRKQAIAIALSEGRKASKDGLHKAMDHLADMHVMPHMRKKRRK